MKTADIRESYLQFFAKRGHAIERSDKVVPYNDPTLLFTSAGMVQFKPYYTGEAPVPYRRATTSQKCLRAGGKANDLDEVGKTSRHLTFFEMLGNFSFGDYFKREAIEWAWEFTTQVLRIAPEKVIVSIYKDDPEAGDIWEKEIGVPRSRIVPLGAKDNFWGPAGDTGACGPCSELLYDRGESIDPSATLENDPHERYMEFWNLVFPQFDQQLDGSRPQLVNRGIDTGMGLERISALLQGVPTVFDIDGIIPIIQATESICGVRYGDNPTPFRVIADHIRALSFMIADGVLPGNEGRGYVERRLLRRAARFGRELGLEDAFLYKVSEAVIDVMGGQYPELRESAVRIGKIIHTEEKRFQSTLARGMDLMGEILEKAGAPDAIHRPIVPGADLFRLHDTYGFPLDLATDIAEDRGYAVDRDGFMAAMSCQKEQARGAWAGSGQESIAPVYRQVRDDVGDTSFVGYDARQAKAKVLAIIVNGQRVNELTGGAEGEIVLDATPFYAESGGQAGDAGVLECTGGSAHVTCAKALIGRMTLHQVKMTRGILRQGDTIEAMVNDESREATESHHTATHLLQAALRDILGDHAHQAGSLVNPGRLRFDFTHFEAIEPAILQDIERTVNRYIRASAPVKTEFMSLEEARKMGAMALFGEKYEDNVRVVRAGDISMELCGGTHVDNTGKIGTFVILSESSISAGVRRIEALCGEPAMTWLLERETQLMQASSLLNTPPAKLAERIGVLQEENKRLVRELGKWKQAAATGGAIDHMSHVQEVNGVRLLAVDVPGLDPGSLRGVMDQLRDKLGSGVVVLGSAQEDKVLLCVAVTKDLTARVKAGDMIKRLAPIVGGSGGGKPELAQAGGKSPDKLPEALAEASAALAALLG